jgi:hypothetical protein
MRRIRRYTVNITSGVFQAPKEAVLLGVGEAGGNLVVFASVDEAAPITEQNVNVFANGDPIPDSLPPMVGMVQHKALAQTFFVFQS